MIRLVLFFIIVIILGYFFEKDNQPLFDSETINKINEIYNKLDNLDKSKKINKINEFSIKLTPNKVNILRYSLGLQFFDNTIYNDVKKIFNIDKKLISMADNHFKKKTKKYLFGHGFDLEDKKERIYYFDYDKKSIISHEKHNNNYYNRYYDETEEMQNFYKNVIIPNLGVFQNTFLDMCPCHKINKRGLIFTNEIENYISIRFSLKEYQTVYHLKPYILLIGQKLQYSNDKIKKIRNWLNKFEKHEISNIGLTVKPYLQISIYCNA